MDSVVQRKLAGHQQRPGEFPGGRLEEPAPVLSQRQRARGNVLLAAPLLLDRGGKRDFYRVDPAQGYACDPNLKVVRGKAA